ncbi:MAG: hypothetical protein GY842_20020 [bacterium]|nr:hypothetical protein [bacterium]
MRVRRLMAVLATMGSVPLWGAPAKAEVVYTSQTRSVAYEIEVGDPYSSDVYEDSISAPDLGPFDESLYFNIKWPSEIWVDVEGRASNDQSSSLTDTLVTAAGMSHVHAYVEEDQTQAFAEAISESLFFVEFDLTSGAIVDLSGETTWVRTTVDPPQEVSVRVTLYEGGVAIFAHVREYIYPSGVGEDDGEVVAFADTLAAGSYALEIVARTEAYSQGPYRQYAEGTATYDVTMSVSAPGDLDGDGEVDVADHGIFLDCMAGPEVTEAPPECDPSEFLVADLEGDGDVDLADFAAFQEAFTGLPS